MAWTVDKKRTYRREVRDAETGEVAEVELRKFTEGDFQDRDGLSISMRLEQRRKGRKARKGQPETDVDYTPGRVRLFEMERALVSWSIPLPLNIISIKSLDPAVAKQIHEHIQDLNPFFFESGEEEDEDEDEGEVHPLSAAPSSEPEQDGEEYGEYGGPKESAQTS